MFAFKHLVNDSRYVREDQTKSWLDRTIEVSLGCVGGGCNLPQGEQRRYWLICFECINNNENSGSKMDNHLSSIATGKNL